MINTLKYNEPVGEWVPYPTLTKNPIYEGDRIMANSSVAESPKVCQVSMCNRPAKTREYCKTHYEMLRRKGAFTEQRCNIDGCNKPIYALKLCRSHWRRLKAYGDPLVRNKFSKNHIEINGAVCVMDLYRNNIKIAETIFDRDDYAKVKDLKWCLSEGKTSKYVRHVKKGIQLHRLIFGDVPNGFEIDHANRDTLDNRKANLRLATRSLNSANSKRQVNNKSGFKGVFWSKQKGKYIAMIQANKQLYYLGCSDDPVRLAIKYNEAAIKHFGEFAVLNGV